MAAVIAAAATTTKFGWPRGKFSCGKHNRLNSGVCSKNFLLHPLVHDLLHNPVDGVDDFLVRQIVVVAKNRECDRAAGDGSRVAGKRAHVVQGACLGVYGPFVWRRLESVA